MCGAVPCGPDASVRPGHRWHESPGDLARKTLRHHFRRLLTDSGVECLRLPAKSPNLNAFAERFVLSIKSECLEHLILFSEGQLRRAVSEYVAHYHTERNHQGLGNRLIEGDRAAANQDGSIRCRLRLGGLLRHYHREAA